MFPLYTTQKGPFQKPRVLLGMYILRPGGVWPSPRPQKRTKHEQNVIVMRTKREQKYLSDVCLYNIA